MHAVVVAAATVVVVVELRFLPHPLGDHKLQVGAHVGRAERDEGWRGELKFTFVVIVAAIIVTVIVIITITTTITINHYYYKCSTLKTNF